MGLVAAMIVKNEAAVLARCFASLLPHVQHIVINDNGSTDETPTIINILTDEVAIEVPGEWVNYAVNRNLVLNVARAWGDYVLCGIDADEELVVPEGYVWPELTADAYTVELRLGNLSYPRVAIVKSSAPWEWKYPIHEGLYSTGDASLTIGTLPGIYIQSHRDGHRASNPETALRDLDTLQRFNADNPYDPRMTFYLAQQYKDLKMLPDALEWYLRRAALDGFLQEKWYSKFMIARILDWQGIYPIPAYLEAHEMNPQRAEPLYYAGDWCRRLKLFNQALLFAASAQREMPADGLFVEPDIYEWRVLDLISIVAWYTPYKRAGIDAATELMGRSFPLSEAVRIAQNAAFYIRMKT